MTSNILPNVLPNILVRSMNNLCVNYSSACVLFLILLKFASTSTYAVGIYLFIKHGDKKLKWYVIIPYITVMWTVVTLILNVPPNLEEFGAQTVKGFCTAKRFLGPYIGMHGCLAVHVGAMFFLSIELISCIYSLS